MPKKCRDFYRPKVSEQAAGTGCRLRPSARLVRPHRAGVCERSNPVLSHPAGFRTRLEYAPHARECRQAITPHARRRHAVLGACLLAGVVHADWQSAKQAWRQGDHVTALQAWQSLAEGGEPAAQYNLAPLYRDHPRTPGGSAAEVLRLLQAAAGQGLAAAQFLLAEHHAREGAPPREVREAGSCTARRPIRITRQRSVSWA